MFPLSKKCSIVSYAALSNVGRVLEENQDNLFCDGIFRHDLDATRFNCAGTARIGALFAVADGLGGAGNGALAAREAVCALEDVDRAGGTAGLSTYLHACNARICEKGRTWGADMGTTFAGILLQDGEAHLANLGDSRIYLFRAGQLQQRSHDHTVAQSMLDMGLLTAEQARIHPCRHELTQYLGIPPEEMVLAPHTETLALAPGDTFLLCSDGLTKEVEDETIAAVLRTLPALPDAVRLLLECALARGGRDNITVLLVRYG